MADPLPDDPPLLLETITEYGIVQMDEDGFVRRWNTGAERIFGYSRDGVLGRDARMLFTPKDRAGGESEKELHAARENGRAIDERWHVRKHGERFWASSVTIPLIDREDQLRGYARIMRDATERKRAEEAHRMESIGRLAWLQSHDGPVHLVLTDMVMPNMGGAELAGRVGELRPDMPILFMSGYTEESVLPGSIFESPAFLQKPFGFRPARKGSGGPGLDHPSLLNGGRKHLHPAAFEGNFPA